MKKINCSAGVLFSVCCILHLSAESYCKVVEVKPGISIRQVAIKNVSYTQDGNYFAIPNYVTAGSVGVFSVSPSGTITEVSSRLSEKDFYRSRGVFYYAGRKDTLTDMAFIPLAEYTKGYSVSFTNRSDTLAVCGNDKISIFQGKNWAVIKIIDLKGVSRAVFSPDNSILAAVADGRIHVLKMPSCSQEYTIEPENGCRFADVTFSNSGTVIAAYEYKNQVMDNTSRIRLFTTNNGNEERSLPWFEDKISTVPGNHFPLLSYLPSDSAIAVTLEKAFLGKTVIIKSNDGTKLREFKGSCHATSSNGTFFAAGGGVYLVENWTKVGNIPSSALCMSFSTQTPYLLVVSSGKIQRFRIDTNN